MEAEALTVKDTVSASQKLGRDHALKLIDGARRVIVAKGKKLSELVPGQDDRDAIVEAMLGPTGNLRAPTLVVGDTIFVGFNAEKYAAELAG